MVHQPRRSISKISFGYQHKYKNTFAEHSQQNSSNNYKNISFDDRTYSYQNIDTPSNTVSSPVLFPVNKPASITNSPLNLQDDLFSSFTSNEHVGATSIPEAKTVKNEVIFDNKIVVDSQENVFSERQILKAPQNKISESNTNSDSVKSKSTPEKSVPQNKIIRTTNLRKETSSNSSPQGINQLFWYVIRLLILGVGVGTIAGTVLSNLDYTKLLITKVDREEIQPKKRENIPEETQKKPLPPPLVLTKELTSLKDKLRVVAAKYPKLQPGIFLVDLDNGAYADIEADTAFSAASTIKIPVLVAFFENVDAGKIHLDEKLTMTKETIGKGSGSMQYQKIGTKFSALETATKTIVISDNTGTNMLIDRLGGAEALNKRFQDWGLKSTVIRNPLPDLKGTNTTSPKDLAYLLARVERGELLSLRSRDRLLGIMRRTRTKTLLPRGLERGAIIAHKTGDIGSVLGDAGVIDMPSGKRYIAAVIVKRPHNDYTTRTLIQQMSRTAYQHFKWYDKPASPDKK